MSASAGAGERVSGGSRVTVVRARRRRAASDCRRNVARMTAVSRVVCGFRGNPSPPGGRAITYGSSAQRADFALVLHTDHGGLSLSSTMFTIILLYDWQKRAEGIRYTNRACSLAEKGRRRKLTCTPHPDWRGAWKRLYFALIEPSFCQTQL